MDKETLLAWRFGSQQWFTGPNRHLAFVYCSLQRTVLELLLPHLALNLCLLNLACSICLDGLILSPILGWKESLHLFFFFSLNIGLLESLLRADEKLLDRENVSILGRFQESHPLHLFYFSFRVLMQCFCIFPVIRSGLLHRILALTWVMWQLLTICTAEDFDDLRQIWWFCSTKKCRYICPTIPNIFSSPFKQIPLPNHKELHGVCTSF